MSERTSAEPPSITCPICNMTSWNPNDVAGQQPTAVVVVAFTPDNVAVALLHPKTDDTEEVIVELDRYWAKRAEDVLAHYE